MIDRKYLALSMAAVGEVAAEVQEVAGQVASNTSQLAAVETYFLTGSDDYGSIIDDPIVSLDWGTL